MSEKAKKQPTSQSPGEPIMGLVADILNEREIVINIGKDHGVTIDMKFAVLDYVEYEVKDPETGEVLDKLPPREKVRVKVVELTDKIAVARTYETVRKNVGGIGPDYRSLFGSLGGPAEWVEKPVTFRIGESGNTYYDYKKLSPEESIVQIGDTVRQIL